MNWIQWNDEKSRDNWDINLFKFKDYSTNIMITPNWTQYTPCRREAAYFYPASLTDPSLVLKPQLPMRFRCSREFSRDL